MTAKTKNFKYLKDKMKIFIKSTSLIVCCRQVYQVDRNILIPIPIYLIY